MAARMNGASKRKVIRDQIRVGLRVKLRPISISSRSIARKPWSMLMRQKGIRMAISTNITPKLPAVNQMDARMAQPIAGKELRTGFIRRSEERRVGKRGVSKGR